MNRGAKTAMTLALRSPDLVRDIVAVDNAPVDAALRSDFSKYIQAMKRIEAAGVTRQAEADKILAEYEPALPIRQFLLGNLYRPASGSPQKFRVPLSILARALDHMGDFPYKDPIEVQFKKPALFVRGTRSKYVPDEVIPIIGQFFPKFELADVEAGHWVISENPEGFREGKSLSYPDIIPLTKHRLTITIQLCSGFSAGKKSKADGDRLQGKHFSLIVFTVSLSASLTPVSSGTIGHYGTWNAADNRRGYRHLAGKSADPEPSLSLLPVLYRFRLCSRSPSMRAITMLHR